MGKERWKPINGFEGYYEVSNMGRVKSVKRVIEMSNQFGPYLMPIKEKIFGNWINDGGYCSVILQKNRYKKTLLVHRLVALHFIPNPENKTEVNHKKGIKTDNRASQLEWSTPSENQKHAYRVLGRVSVKGNRKLTDEQILGIRKMHASGMHTLKNIYTEYGICRTHLYRVINNELWQDVI